MRVLKFLLGSLLTLLTLVAVSVVVLPRIIDVNDFKSEIEQLVADKLQRQLSLDGDLQLSVFPWLGIETQGLSLSQPEGMDGQMLVVDNAQLRVKLLPLLSKKIEVDTIKLDAPQVKLIRLADGRSSLDFADAEQVENDSLASDAGIALLVKGIEISNASLEYIDQQANQHIELRNLALSSGDLLSGRKVALQASGSYLDRLAGDSELSFELSAKAQINSDRAELILIDSVLSIQQDGLSATGNIAHLQVNQTARLDMRGLNFAGQLTEFDEQGNTLKWQVDGQGLHFANKVATLQMLNAQLERDGKRLQLSSPTLSADLSKQQLELPKVTLSYANAQVALGNVQVNNGSATPRATGTLRLNIDDVRTLLDSLAIEYRPQNNEAMKSLGVNARFDATPTALQFKALQLNLDESQMTGELSVNSFDKPQLQFDLSLDAIDLDAYLPVSEQQESSDSSDALIVPLAAMEQLNANGRFRAVEVISSGVKVENIDVQFTTHQGQLTVSPRASLYKGSLEGDIQLVSHAGNRTLKLKNELDLVELAGLLVDADITDQLSGLGSMLVDVEVNEKDGQQTNQGTIRLQAKNGTIRGVDVEGMIRQAYSGYQLIRGRNASEDQSQDGQSRESDETPFTELDGTFYLHNFRLTNNDFSMIAPLFKVAGEGELDLQAQSIDYLLKINVVNSIDGQVGDALEKLSGITLPVRLTGNLAAPDFSLDMKSLYRAIVKKELDKRKAEFAKEKLGLEGGENLSAKDLLKQAIQNRLFGREEEEPDLNTEPEQDTQAQPEDGKDQLKRDLTEKLLEGLFN